MNKTSNKYSPEVRDHSVRMVLDNQGQDVRFIENDPFDGHAGQLRMVTRKGDTILRLDSDGDDDADLSIFLEDVTQRRDSDFVF